MKNINLQAALEAMLFANGDPIQITKISDVLGVSYDDAINICESLKTKLKETSSGIKLVKIKESYQLCTCGEYKEYIQEIMDLKKNMPLSSAAMEVVSIIAYNEPVTRAFVDQVRGVDCSYIIGILCQRGLIEERGRLELPGRPLIYGTTDKFLRCFGLGTLKDLPIIPEEETIEEETALQK